MCACAYLRVLCSQERFLVPTHVGSRAVAKDPLMLQVPAHVDIDEEDDEEAYWLAMFARKSSDEE